MKDITKEELNTILENHKHWINRDIDDWENMRANLSYANLKGVDLSGAELHHAILYGADLKGANLSGAYLLGSNLEGANLSDSNLEGANLRIVYLDDANLSGAHLLSANLKYSFLDSTNLEGANLSEANLGRTILNDANLSGANLIGANLLGAVLNCANLSDANLEDADLRFTYLRNANLSGAYLEHACLLGANLCDAMNVPYIPMTCPDTGAFIGWKKCRDDVIVKLLIPEDAKRSSATGRKCRCDKAIVLDIEGADIAYSYRDNDFIYRKGETVTVDDFDDDRFVECGPGIHFFINRDEAVTYDNF